MTALREKQANRVLIRDTYSCRLCGQQGSNKGLNHTLEIHHIFPFLTGRRLGLTRGELADSRNLITLCLQCHIETFPTQDKSTEFKDKYIRALTDIGYFDWYSRYIKPELSGRPEVMEDNQWQP